MGGNDSKEEQSIPEQQQFLPEVSAGNNLPSNNNIGLQNSGGRNSYLSGQQSPRISGRNSNISGRNSKIRIPTKKQTLHPKTNKKPLQQSLIGSNPNYNEVNDKENIEQSEKFVDFFEEWDPKFHHEGQMNVNINIVKIDPVRYIKKLQRKSSKHKGQLSWSYQKPIVQKRRQLFLRFIFEESEGYTLNFLVDQNTQVMEGDQAVWNLICPYRTQEQVTKVGIYNCQRTYEAEEEQGLLQQKIPDAQLYTKWQQSDPEPRQWMKQLLELRREQLKIKNNIGFDYMETNKYFNSNDEWVYSVLIEEKNNTFKSYIIELEREKSQSDPLAQTLQNDIQIRQNLYIEEMKKKRDILKKGERGKKM